MDYLFLPPFIIPNPMQYSTANVTVTPPFSSISELLLNFNRRDFDRECCHSDEIVVVAGERSAVGRDVSGALAHEDAEAIGTLAPVCRRRGRCAAGS